MCGYFICFLYSLISKASSIFQRSQQIKQWKKSGFLASYCLCLNVLSTFMTNFIKIYFHLENNFIFESDMRLDPLQSLLRAPLLEGRSMKKVSHSRLPNLWEHNTVYYKIDRVLGKILLNFSFLDFLSNT